MAGVKKRLGLANYLTVNWVNYFVGRGFTLLDESPSAQIVTKRYINDSSSTQSVTGYAWATPLVRFDFYSSSVNV